MTALVGDGSTIPPFIVTKSRNIPLGTIDENRTGAHVEVMPTTKGESAALVVNWLTWAQRSGYLVEGDMIICDNGSGFRSSDFDLHLQDAGLRLLHFPPLMGALMNPCDNSFHADFKLKLHKLMAREGRFNQVRKIQLAVQAYQDTKDSSIQNYMHLTGITGGDPERVTDRLLEKSLESNPRLTADATRKHNHAIEVYRSWKDLRHQLRNPQHHPLDLPGSELDGIYWRSYEAV